jgi:hypothetical protein
MSAIVVEDLPRDITLDHQAMTAVEGGGGAPWIYGWITPYAPSEPSVGPVVNLYEVNNNFYAQQMINQFQSVDVRNSGANSNITVNPNARSSNQTA